MAIKYYVGERVERYDRMSYKPRHNVNRFMNPTPVSRRSNRHYEPPKEPGYWANIALGTAALVVVLFFVWFISG